MKIKTIKLYEFSELSETAKEKAIENLRDINVGYDWWECTYEDAENIGLKINGFDLDGHRYCDAQYIEDACYTAYKIKAKHGENCETYKDAVNFLKERDETVNSAVKDENGDFENEYELDKKLDAIEYEFLKTLQEDYSILLQKEYEYRISKEAIKETIEANEYTFTENGELEN